MKLRYPVWWVGLVLGCFGPALVMGQKKGEGRPVVEYLVEAGERFHPVLRAVDRQEIFALRTALMKNGALTAVTGEDETALHLACRVGNLAMIGLLVEAGADMEARDILGWTPLTTAAAMGRAGTVSWLRTNGADFRAVDNEGRCALMWAVARGHVPVVKFLATFPPQLQTIDQAGRNVYEYLSTKQGRKIYRILTDTGQWRIPEERRTWDKDERVGAHNKAQLLFDDDHYKAAIPLLVKAERLLPEAARGSLILLAFCYARVLRFDDLKRVLPRVMATVEQGELEGALLIYQKIGKEMLLARNDELGIQEVERLYGGALAFDARAMNPLRLELAGLKLKQGYQRAAIDYLESYLVHGPDPSQTGRVRAALDWYRYEDDPVVHAFPVRSPSGEPLDMRAYLGKVVLLYFWAGSGREVVEALPWVQRWAGQAAEFPWFEVIGINADVEFEDYPQLANRQVRKWPQFHDPEGMATREYFQVRRLPGFVVFDHKGRELARMVGYHGHEDMDATIEKALKKAKNAAKKKR